jgi:hypothetical protein
MGEKLINAGVGGAAGAAGTKLLNIAGGKLSSMLASKGSEAAAKNAMIAPKKAILEAGQQAGYVVPPSAVNPTFLGNRLESIAGKDALTQASALKNQDVTNKLAGDAINVDGPLLPGTIERSRASNYKPYEDIANLPSNTAGYSGVGNNSIQTAKHELEQMKQARNDAQAWYKAAERSASPDDLAKAKSAERLAESLDAKLTQKAQAAGNPELMDELYNARREIAKTYDIEKAANVSTGDVSAPIIGRAHDKAPKVRTGNLKLIGDMANTFRPYMREGENIRTPGVSKVEAGMSALLGSTGGVASMGIPLISTPVRALLLSKPYQKLIVNYPDKQAPATLKALTKLINSQKIKGMTPALSSDLATYLLNNDKQ